MVKKKTGYSVYNEEVKKRLKNNEMPNLYPDLPNEKFDIIYADPPWHYNGKLQFDKSSKGVDEIDLKRNNVKILTQTLKFANILASLICQKFIPATITHFWRKANAKSKNPGS